MVTALLAVQIHKLREKLEAIAKELASTDKETFLSINAAARAAEFAALPLTGPSSKTASQAPHAEQYKAEEPSKLKAKERKLKKQMKPKVNDLEEAEKRPKLFEPAVGPPPKVGKEELAAEGSGQEVLLQVPTFVYQFVFHVCFWNPLCLYVSGTSPLDSTQSGVGSTGALSTTAAPLMNH